MSDTQAAGTREPRRGMDAQEYQMTMDLVMNSALILHMLPLDQVLETISFTESCGAILDPTAFHRGMHKLQPQRELVEAALAFLRAAQKAAEIIGAKG